MLLISKNRLRSLAISALACLAFVVSGCLPAVVWLPDSSGFLYVATDARKLTRLVHFDLATKQPRVLIEKAEETAQPALSPDGKRIAFAHLAREGKAGASTLQVVLFDPKGKELSRSKQFAWVQADGGSAINVPPALYWSPRGEHIVVYAEGVTGLYDVKNATLKVFPDTLVAPIAGNPARPDGVGFLVVKAKHPEQNKSPVYAFFDWQGKEQELKTPPKLLEQGPAEPDFGPYLAGMVYGPSMHPTRWEKNVAIIHFSGSTLEVDTDKKEVRLKQGALLKSADNLLIHSRYPLDNGAEVRVVLLPRPKMPKGKEVQTVPTMRVELLLPDKKVKLLVPVVVLVTATPSPNGEWLALRCFTGQGWPNGQEADPLFVINRKGEILAVGPVK